MFVEVSRTERRELNDIVVGTIYMYRAPIEYILYSLNRGIGYYRERKTCEVRIYFSR